MGACWHCYWGWPKQVMDIYRKYCEPAYCDAMHFGPAHIVWEDENFEDYNIESCLEQCKRLDYWTHERGFTEGDVEHVRESLVELMQVPEEIRCEPEDYDDEHPENFPPAPGLVMVRKR